MRVIHILGFDLLIRKELLILVQERNDGVFGIQFHLKTVL